MPTKKKGILRLVNKKRNIAFVWAFHGQTHSCDAHLSALTFTLLEHSWVNHVTVNGFTHLATKPTKPMAELGHIYQSFTMY